MFQIYFLMMLFYLFFAIQFVNIDLQLKGNNRFIYVQIYMLVDIFPTW